MQSVSKSFLAAMLAFIFVGCKQNPVAKSYTKETAFFNKYLEESFHATIPTTPANYVLVSEYGCGGCISKTLAKVGSAKNSVVIVSLNSNAKYKEYLELCPKVLVDSESIINRLPYHAGNVGILLTSNSQIDTIIQINAGDIDEQIDAAIQYRAKKAGN